MNIKRRLVVFAALAAITLSAFHALAVRADSIGVQFFGGNGASSATLDPAQVAGVVPQAHYNTTSGFTSPVSNLRNDAGNATGAVLSFAPAGFFHTADVPASGPDEMLNGGLANGASLGGQSYTISGIPYSTYDLIVYELDNEVRTQKTTVGSTSFYLTSPNGGSTGYVDGNPHTDYTYNQGISTNGASPTLDADFVRFNNLSDSSVTFTVDATQATFSGNLDSNSFVNGFQIIQTPEPTSLGLLLVSSLRLLGRRRKV